MKELLVGCIGLLGLAACRKEEAALAGGADRKVAAKPAAVSGVEGGKTTPNEDRKTAAPRPKLEKKSEFPVAKIVEGQPGFVTSPFNKQIVDVRGVPPGTLVLDPTYPTAEKRYFRVPDRPTNPSVSK